MSKFVKYKLKDGRVIRGRYNHDTYKVLISQEDLEGLLNEANVAYEQAKQLQTIIENLQEIKAGAVRKALDEIRAEIETQRKEVSNKKSESNELQAFYDGLNDGLKDARDIIDKYRKEQTDADSN